MSMNKALESSKKGKGEENSHSEVDFVAQMISMHIRIKLQKQKFSPPGQKLDFFFKLNCA